MYVNAIYATPTSEDVRIVPAPSPELTLSDTYSTTSTFRRFRAETTSTDVTSFSELEDLYEELQTTLSEHDYLKAYNLLNQLDLCLAQQINKLAPQLLENPYGITIQDLQAWSHGLIQGIQALLSQLFDQPKQGLEQHLAALEQFKAFRGKLAFLGGSDFLAIETRIFNPLTGLHYLLNNDREHAIEALKSTTIDDNTFLPLVLRLFEKKLGTSLISPDSFSSNTSSDPEELPWSGHYKEAIAFIPLDDADNYALVGFCHAMLGDYEKAQFHYEQAIALDKNNEPEAEWIAEMALISLLQDDRAEAAKHILSLPRDDEATPIITLVMALIMKA